MCDPIDLPSKGCFNAKENTQTNDLYQLHYSIVKLGRLEYVLLVIIFADLVVKLYNDKMVKQDIEFRMQKESTKDISVTHDVSLDNQPNSYKNINIRNG
jgi:hypothetical protein